jgi:hypothetical protein
MSLAPERQRLTVAWWWWLILAPILWCALAIALGPIVGQWIHGPRKKGE